MHYALYLPCFDPFGDARIMAELAREAEAAGWDGFFIWDHIATGGDMPVVNMVDPWVALAAVAMTTTRIRLGTMITPLARRRPWKLARETVSIDRLSNGRLILGVGLGMGEAEFDHLDEETDPVVRGQMLDEALDVLAGLWQGEPFNYAGQHYHVTNAHFIPTPVQTRIPVWVGGFWPHKAPMRRAAGWDGMVPLFYELEGDEADHLRDAIAYTRAHRESDAPLDVAMIGRTWMTDPDQDAATVARFAEIGATWWLELLTAWYPGCTELLSLEALRARVRKGPPRR